MQNITTPDYAACDVKVYKHKGRILQRDERSGRVTIHSEWGHMFATFKTLNAAKFMIDQGLLDDEIKRQDRTHKRIIKAATC